MHRSMNQDDDTRLSLDYLPRLDGLRAIAVMGVLVEHFAPWYWLRALSPGGAGVSLFFVLSGYLITRILLQYGNRRISVRSAALHFYWRRFLRLSPPYYLTIIAAAVIGVSQIREDWWIHALYLTNFQIALSGKWGTGGDHFWSLCTEEQFYLLWFFIVVATRRQYLLPAILASFAITLLFRSFVYIFALSPLTNVLLPGNLASLGMGALLAYAEITGELGWLIRAATERRFLIVIGVLFAAISVSLPFIYFPRAVLYPFSASLFFACVVLSATRTPSNPHLDPLSWAPLRHIGKISYGIFVYHLLVRQVLKGLPVTGPIVENNGWGGFALLCLSSVLVAQVSWKFIEQPILRNKDRVAWPMSVRPG